MALIFLSLIYISFIGLGLPDALLGSAWPVMQIDLGVPVSWAGIISLIITSGTILSSFQSGRLIRRFGTGPLTFGSVLLTCVALFGFSFAPSFFWLLLLAVPFGIGAGSVDAALNNYVARNFEAKHMNWLHSFWGVGATIGPMIMGYSIAQQAGWQMGYRSIAYIQVVIVIMLLFSLPMWNKHGQRSGNSEAGSGQEHSPHIPFLELLKLPAMKASLITFFFYTSIELGAGLWGSSFLVSVKGIAPETAARWIAFYYGGITAGRMLSGFLNHIFTTKQLIRGGIASIFIGAGMLLLPLPSVMYMFALILVGLGCAPIFPGMLHETPVRFGSDKSESIMGVQMGIAYTGSAIMPPFMGFVAGAVGMWILPWFLLSISTVLLLLSMRVDRLTAHQEK